MKAISVLQPWAWLLANGHKPVENRRWATKFRGPVLIHAGKRWGAEQRADLTHVRLLFPQIRLPTVFDLGGIVGRADVVDCVSSMDSPWFFGPYGFVMSNAQPLPFTEFRGALGFFEVPDEVVPSGSDAQIRTRDQDYIEIPAFLRRGDD